MYTAGFSAHTNLECKLKTCKAFACVVYLIGVTTDTRQGNSCAHDVGFQAAEGEEELHGGGGVQRNRRIRV